MATMAGGPLGPPIGIPSGQEQVKRRVSNRSKTFAKKDEKRNSALGFFSLFNRKTSDKTRSAIFHSDDSLDGDRQSITSSNPSLASPTVPLPYPLHPLGCKSVSSSALLLPHSPVASVDVVYATELSLAEEVHGTAGMEDEQAPPYYDDNDVNDSNDVATDDSHSSSPEFSPRQYSLIRRQCIRRKETGSGRSQGKQRRFTHSGITSNQPGQVPSSDCTSFPMAVPNKFARGLSTPVTSSGAETSSDCDDDSSTIVSNGSMTDVVDQDQLPTLIVEIKAISAPCPIHRNMSQKHCAICKCPRDVHDVTHKESVNVHDRLGLNKEGEEEHHRHHHQQHPQLPVSSSRVMPLNKGARPTSSDVYSWIPAGLVPDQIDGFMTCWPKDKVPKRNSQGDRWREHQLAFQLPRQDLALAYCRYVEPQNHASYQDFVAARNDIALDIAYVKETSTRALKCYGCDGNIPAGSFGVLAPKFGENVAWHPACFQCTTCAELLVDLTYCVHEEQLYCERHYAEQLKPRCSACDELIFSGEYTKAMSKDWHLGHFSCWQCDESLTGQRYVLRDEHPYCVKCYETVFANNCDDCNRVIGIDSKDLSYKDRHWHEACFLCNKCRLSLVDKQFGSKADKIFCGPCYDSMYATRCDGCGEIFRAGTKKMEYKSRQWHEKCFSCFVCKTPIGTKSFIPREQDIYCSGCYEEKFATRCVKCTKIITTGGVTYKNDPWHRECFTCTHCDKSLAGQRFTSKDEKPYCAECFGELFAKRCTACTKPITGIGGTRFISFEDRHWHNDCFQCASCNVTLVGKGFITDGADILCPECAKQRVL
uniref:Four and a half LIM domains protein n=1 Tax=Daphnia magna TaxID=35525 RepID=A0A0P6CY81_9CRUS